MKLWPVEADNISEQLGIQSVNATLLSKKQFSQLLDAVLVQKEEQILKEESLNMEKKKLIRSDEWGLKNYVTQVNLYSAV